MKVKETQSKSPQVFTEFAWFILVATSVKLLFIPSYRSTDFEVHRNWLAITNSFPLSKWYFDESSPWTLDYPPFFAYFERLLSVFAKFVDPNIVNIHHSLNHDSPSVIYFQRGTVIISDICLFFGVYLMTKNLDYRRRSLIWVLILWSPGLLIVDHIHFQYNGLLLGLLVTSLSYLERGRDLMGGFLFAVLLCFKHLFAVAAPVYFVYLLRHYCHGGMIRGFIRFLMMSAVVIAVFAASYGPFLYHGQIDQLMSRMFPFSRGLCHAYWAPNFWVFYIIFDKGLAFLLKELGFNIPVPAASYTGGLVGDSSPFSVLPQIRPWTTFILVLLSLSPCLIKAWRDPKPGLVTRLVAYAYTCGFFFGWHVHEKASLHFVILLAIVSLHGLEDARHYFLLSIVSCYSLFPLLFQAQEYPIKVLLLLVHSILVYAGFSTLFGESATAKAQSKGGAPEVKEGFSIGWVGRIYLLGLVVVEIWGQFLHPFVLSNSLPFLPLMLVSLYCALGIAFSWIWQLKWIVGN